MTGDTQVRALQLELLAILQSIKVVEHQRRKAVFALLNEENKTVSNRVIKYFVQEELDTQQSLTLWRKLLSYRDDMVQAYGDRVSLHIACYHLTRDPDSLEEVGLPSAMRCTKVAQSLAIQELKAWWERCNESGAHLKEVMDQQLERMVYRANKNHQLLSFVLVKIDPVGKESINSETRSAFARHLMDSCRCRDIVGHYEQGLLAIIFPQTPAEGAKIAIGRVSQFFHDKFGENQYRWRVAIATCPENGDRPQDLVMMAYDKIRSLKKGEVDQVESCIGKPSAIYVQYVKWLRQPIYDTLHSPVRSAIAIVIFISAILAMFQVTGSNSSHWKIEFEQRMNEHQVFPNWTWGREGSQAFKLAFEDGYVSHSNEFILEHLEGKWFSIPDTKSDRVKLQFSLWLSALGELEVSFIHQNLSGLSLKFKSNHCLVLQSGLVLYKIPYTSIVDDYIDIEIDWGPKDLSIVKGGESLLVSSSLPFRRESSQIKFSMGKGYSLISDLKVYGKKSQDDLEIETINFETILGNRSNDFEIEKNRLLNLDHALKTDNLQELISNYLNEETRAPIHNLNQLLDFAELRNLLIMQMGKLKADEKQLLLNSSQFPNWLSKLATFDLDKLQSVYEKITEPEEEFMYLWTSAHVFRENMSKELHDWLWAELFFNSPKDIEKRLELYFMYFKNGAQHQSIQQVQSRLLEFGNLAIKNSLDVYHAIKTYVDQLNAKQRQELLSFDYINSNSVLQLIVLQWMSEGEERIECIERISLDIGKSNFGKVMCFEWMWFSVSGVETLTREEKVLLEQLSLQSRRPELARLALEILEN